jgi:DNA-binding HxlR family transcriptional regulator
MSDFDYQRLDDLIHSRIRLAIMAVLISVAEAEFTFLRKMTKATDGNLSVSLRKLEDAGYISVKKSFVNRKPRSTYQLTRKGHKAFKVYVSRMENLILK